MPMSARQGQGSPGAGVVDGCELLAIGDRNQAPVLCKSAKCFSLLSLLSSPCIGINWGLRRSKCFIVS